MNNTFIDPFSGEVLSTEVLECVEPGVCPKCYGKGKLLGNLPNGNICYACQGSGKITSSDLARAYKTSKADEPCMGWLDRVSGITE